jgi:hypothetical protein
MNTEKEERLPKLLTLIHAPEGRPDQATKQDFEVIAGVRGVVLRWKQRHARGRSSHKMILFYKDIPETVEILLGLYNEHQRVLQTEQKEAS